MKEKGAECGKKTGGASNGDVTTEENNNNHINNSSSTSTGSSSSSSPLPPERFRPSTDVTVRWDDGLLYRGMVVKCSTKQKDSYLVELSNGNKGWVLKKDLQRRKNKPRSNRLIESEIICSICQGETSVIPNEIVLCDRCGSGFHQECHNPQIPQSVLAPEVPWLCRQCVFASATKKGGATSKGPNAEALQSMKTSLPYDAKSLDWDEAHRQNKQQKYCYCGGPGVWYKKMLQCSRCKQWFHEACIQCLKHPLLHGDRFYIFICSLCNSGPEYIQRLDLNWIDIAHLVLFNLTIENHIKYYDVYEMVIPWLEENLGKLQAPKLSSEKKAERNETLVQVLEQNKNLFASGREVRKKMSLFGLRTCIPPPVLGHVIPASGIVTAEVMTNIKTSGIKTKTVTPVNSSIRLSSGKRKASSQPGDFTHIVKKARKLVSQSAATRNKALIKKAKARKFMNGHRLHSHRVKRSLGTTEPEPPSKPKNTPSISSPSPKKTSLEAIIPRLSDYHGLNHPFKTVLERNQEIEHRKMKDLLLNAYSCEDQDSDAGQTDSFSECASDAASSGVATDVSANNIQDQTSGYTVRRRRRGRKTLAEKAYMEAISIANKSTADQPTASRFPRSSSQRSLPLLKNVVDKNMLDGMKKQQVSMNQLKSSVNSYFGAANRLAYGEGFKVLARRINKEGKVQYLVEWEGGVIS